MRDQDIPAKVGPRTVWCAVCRYDVPAAFQNDDGSKRGVEYDDMVSVAKTGSVWAIMGVALGAWVQNNKAPHQAPCGRQCPSGGEWDATIATAMCPGEGCTTCAAIRAAMEKQR